MFLTVITEYVHSIIRIQTNSYKDVAKKDSALDSKPGL